MPALTDLPELLDLAARAERDEADLPDLQRLVRVGSSLGGARPKAHVRTPDGRLALAKFPSADRDTWDVPAWEKVVLDLAAASGVDVPRSRLLDLAGRRVLVLDRFDRSDRSGAGRRVGYVSALTMLEADDREQRSYLDLAEVVETRSPSPTAELHQLWRRLLVTVLVRSTDDHLRNHGFLHAGGDAWRLAPAFDVNPDPSPGPTYLATSVDGGDAPATVRAVLAVSDWFRLTDATAREVLHEVAAAVAAWEELAAATGLAAAAIRRMAPAFAALAEVPDV